MAVLDLRLEAAEKIADEIAKDGGEALAVSCDVLSRESMEEARNKVNSKLGTCDILINGAGGTTRRARRPRKPSSLRI